MLSPAESPHPLAPRGGPGVHRRNKVQNRYDHEQWKLSPRVPGRDPLCLAGVSLRCPGYGDEPGAEERD